MPADPVTREAVERLDKLASKRLAGAKTTARHKSLGHKSAEYAANFAAEIENATVPGVRLADLRAVLAALSPAPQPEQGLAAGWRETDIRRKAVEFVTEQSEGEWGDDLIQRDAEKLTTLILKLFKDQGEDGR